MPSSQSSAFPDLPPNQLLISWLQVTCKVKLLGTFLTLSFEEIAIVNLFWQYFSSKTARCIKHLSILSSFYLLIGKWKEKSWMMGKSWRDAIMPVLLKLILQSIKLKIFSWQERLRGHGSRKWMQEQIFSLKEVEILDQVFIRRDVPSLPSLSMAFILWILHLKGV